MFDAEPVLELGQYRLTRSRALVMGVLNITPDSFSDGGQFLSADAALARARQMQLEGADILDVGGESTRPGAAEVSLEDELQRVIPIISALQSLNLPISIDTQKTEVMRQAIAAGAVLVNDVNALQADGALALIAATQTAVVLMHRQGSASTMQQHPEYHDVLEEVARFLTDRVLACHLAGLAPRKIILDPGFGFGKSTVHNLELLSNLRRFTDQDQPVLVGLSRKRSIGELTGKASPAERDAGSLAAHLYALNQGAAIIRTHNVRDTRDAIQVWTAIPKPRPSTLRKSDVPRGSSELEALFGV